MSESEVALRAEIQRLKNEVERLKKTNEMLEETLDEALLTVLPSMAESEVK